MTTTESWTCFVCRFVDFDKSKNQFCGDQRTENDSIVSHGVPAGAELAIP